MKRFLSMLLVVVMVFSMIPTAAFADANVAESGISLVLGDNALTLDTSADATAYYFEPAETGVYTFTGPEGSIVGISGYFWVTGLPDSTTNSCQWTCDSVGQSVYIGVSGVESCTLTVAKGEAEETTGPEYVDYLVNTYIYEEAADYCQKVSTDVSAMYSDWGIYYCDIDGVPHRVFVDFNYSGLSINTMLGTGSAKYYEKDADGNIVKVTDYSAALAEFGQFGVYPLNEELATILTNVDEAKGWTEFGWLNGWQELCFVVSNHTDGEPVTEGTEYVTYCSVCGVETYREAIPGTSQDSAIYVAFDENGEATVTVPTGTWYYTYMDRTGSNPELTINGETAEVTTNMFGGAYFSITNEGEEAEYALKLIFPVGTSANPDTLVIGENAATTNGSYTGYVYNWTASEAGTLTITMTEENWFYVVNNMTTGVYGDNHYSDDEVVVSTESIEVAAGDEIQVMVNTYDPETWSNPAGTVNFTAAFEGAAMTPEEIVNAAYELAEGESLEGTYTLTGAITSIDTPYSEQYNNISVWMAVEGLEDKPILCFRLTGEELTELNVNDIITVTGSLTNYYGKIEFVQGCTLDNVVHMDPPVVEAGNGMIDFSTTEQRVSQTASAQVWENDGITFTNNKASSTSSVANYYNPVRIYQGSEVVIEFPNMNKVVFDVNLGKPVTGLQNGLNGLGTVTVDGNIVTLELAEPTDSITFSATAQFRLNNISVYAAETSGEEEGCEHEYFYACDAYCMLCYELTNPDAAHKLNHVAAKEATCTELGNIEYWTCEYCGGCWDNENATGMPLNQMMVKIPMKDHEYFYACDAYCMNCYELTNEEAAHSIKHVEAVEPTCFEEGNIEYWTCEYCNGCWDNENATGMPLNAMSVKLPATHQNIVHMEAVEPGCHYTGNVEHWYCTDCDTVWTDEALTQISNHKSVIIPATGSDLLVHMDAVEPACHYDGNVEYWICYECEQVWTDEALTQLSNIKNVVLPATHNPEAIHVEAKEATCVEYGNIEYWYCDECGQVWQDEALTQLTNRMNVIVPAEHKLVHVEAVEPGCHYTGNVEHWYCTVCDTVWTDEALTQISNHLNVIVPALGGEVVHVEAVEPTCDTFGNIEHWYCETCEQVWQDEALTQLTNHMNVKLAPTHAVEHVEAKDATCFEEGNIEYWYCTECGAAWTDELLREITNLKNVILPAQCAEVKHVEAKEPSCFEEGNIEYWYCEVCGQVWQDENLMQLTNIKNVVLPAQCAEVKHVEAKEPSCFEEGNIEYWYCEVCGQVWQDENLMQLTNIKNVVLPAKCAEVKHVEAKEPSCFEEGNIEYWYCEVCGQVWQDENLMQLTNIKNVVLPAKCAEVKHVEAKEPSCFEEGNIEYWYCEICGQVWQDENLMQLTNIKNVVLPIAHTIEHVEAKEPGCYEEGNIEYWYCTECGYAWTDELLRQQTNLMSVKLPATHQNIVHMESVEPGCHYDGHIEHWYCADCDTVWADEAQMQVTNHKNVILPATGEPEAIHVEAVDATCCEEGNIEYWYCTECEQVWQDEALTQLTNRLNVIIPVDEDAHEWGKWETTKEATCTAKGKETRVCELDEDHKETRDIAKLDHVDKDKDEECDVCEADLSNSKTGDMIMIAVVVMVLAAVAIVVLLTKKRRVA